MLVQQLVRLAQTVSWIWLTETPLLSRKKKVITWNCHCVLLAYPFQKEVVVVVPAIISER